MKKNLVKVWNVCTKTLTQPRTTREEAPFTVHQTSESDALDVKNARGRVVTRVVLLD